MKETNKWSVRDVITTVLLSAVISAPIMPPTHNDHISPLATSTQFFMLRAVAKSIFSAFAVEPAYASAWITLFVKLMPVAPWIAAK